MRMPETCGPCPRNLLVVMPAAYGVNFVRAGLSLGHRMRVLTPLKYETPCPKTFTKSVRVDKPNFDFWNQAELLRQLHLVGPVDGVIPGTEYAIGPVLNATAMLGLPVLGDKSTYETTHDKIRMRNRLAKLLLDTRLQPTGAEADSHMFTELEAVPYQPVMVPDGIDEAIRQLGTPLVFKPSDCAAGDGVTFVRDDRDIPNAIKTISDKRVSFHGMPISRRWIGERLLEGEILSVEVLIRGQRIVHSSCTASKRCIGNHIETGHVVGPELDSQFARERSLAEEIARNLCQDSAAFHIEFIRTASKCFLLEVNARPGGDEICSLLLPFVYGIDYFEELIAYAFGGEESSTPAASSGKSAAIAYWYASHTGKLVQFEGLAQLAKVRTVIQFDLASNKIGTDVDPPTNSAGRLGWVACFGDNPREAWNNVVEARASVHPLIIP